MSKEYKYPFPITTQLPPLADILKAFERADAKDVKYRDIRPLMALLNRLSTVSARLPSHIRKRQSTLMSTNWDIVSASPDDEEETQFVKRRLEKTIRAVVKNYIHNVLYGKFCAGLVWMPEQWMNDGKKASYWTPTDIAVLEPWDTEANSEYPFNIALLTHESASLVRKKLTETTEKSWLTDIFRAKSPGGVLRTVVMPEWLLYMDVQDWRNFNKRVKGLAIASYKDYGAAGTGAQEKAEQAVSQLGDVNWAAVPDTVKFEFLRSVDSVASSSYPEFKKAIEADIAIAIRGTASTSELPEHGGSRAAVEALVFGVEEDIAFLDRSECSDLINEQLIRQDYFRNYSQKEDTNPEIPWRFAWSVKYPQDSEKNARVAELLLRNGMSLYTKEVSEKTGFQIATNEDVIEPKGSQGFGFGDI